MKSLFWLTYIHVQVFLKSHTCMNCLFELFFTTHILNNNQTLSTNKDVGICFKYLNSLFTEFFLFSYTLNEKAIIIFSSNGKQKPEILSPQ